jgi:hypothetical protein
MASASGGAPSAAPRMAGGSCCGGGCGCRH